MLPHEKEEEKRLVRQLPPGKKIEHFFRYYTIQTVAVIGCIAILAALIWNFCFRKMDKTVFSAAVYDDAFEEQYEEAFIGNLKTLFDVTDEHEIVRMEHYLSDSRQDQMKIVVMLAAQEYEVIVAGEEQFKKLAGDGCFADLEEFLDDGTLKKADGRLFYTEGLLEAESQSLDFNGSGKGAVKAYGISLKDSPKWAELHGICTDPVIGVFAGTTRPENALKFVDYLL